MASINQPFGGVNAEPDADVDADPACDAVQLHGLKELTRRELLILLLDNSSKQNSQRSNV